MPKFKAVAKEEIAEEGPERHGVVGKQPVIEPCPNCEYAYADGGYCESCGWFQPRNDCPHCRKKGLI
jgi:uncharacterized protein affecting Mg2+/Co2+ transport